ncbi:MAG TPA: hypothetical protein VNT23_01400, partial [Gaiellaceae bacterium]|nr:hypothetical protein [Gaiellaceae bacterium]
LCVETTQTPVPAGYAWDGERACVETTQTPGVRSAEGEHDERDQTAADEDEAEEAGERGPSALLHLDLGGRGEAQAPLPVQIDAAQELVGRQVVCALGADEVTVLAVHGAEGTTPIHPARDVDPGAPVA